MSLEYPFSEIESKWQKIWKQGTYFKFQNNGNPSYYVLEMLPYPSGKIHMGHVRNYTIGDVISRFFRLNDYDVFHPMGWDAFGLPAENAAIENKVNPAIWTKNNIQEMRKQLQMLGLSYDWDREIATFLPEYYSWNQWFFLQFYKKGLIEKKLGKVNYCNHCQTVLANEQVIDGRCWRCNFLVEQKTLSQWYIKITHYAKQLLEDHKILENTWPSRVLNMQKNWIGESQGVRVTFEVRGYDKEITVFTTRIDTLFGVSFLALALEHPFIETVFESIKNDTLVKEFVKDLNKTSSSERMSDTLKKKGVFTGFFAKNPISGQEIPIYIANFVVTDYGTGALMGVPSHDERDYEFATLYNIPFKTVIQPQDNNTTLPIKEKGTLINSFEFNGLSSVDAAIQITEKLVCLKKGERSTEYKLRDWLISRQRYWGTPIPIVYCDDCGTVPLKEEDLPLILPEDVEFKIGENPILSSPTFAYSSCPQCGKPAKRETDTMDTFVDSSWYFLRYLDPHNKKEAINKEMAKKLLPVNQYIGGIEHATMHLLYSRFFYKVLNEMGLVPEKEPFSHLITQGMVNSRSYYCESCKAYYPPSQITDNTCPKGHTEIVSKMEKMSKSKNNGVDPETLINQYGVDAIRVFTLFAAPIDKDLEWNEKGVAGSFRFLKRFYSLCKSFANEKEKYETFQKTQNLTQHNLKIISLYHQTLHKVTQESKVFHFNTAVASLMELLNTLTSFKTETQTDFNTLKGILTGFSQMLFIFAPHMAEECYALIDGEKSSLYELSWPKSDESHIKNSLFTYVIQMNGKLKASIKLEESLTKEALKEYVLKNYPHIQKSLEEKTLIKEIFVKDKLLNFVVK
jgi:leucyl-tRNA synthetase